MEVPNSAIIRVLNGMRIFRCFENYEGTIQYKQNYAFDQNKVFKTVLLMLHFYDSVFIGISCTKVNSNNMQSMVPVGLK